MTIVMILVEEISAKELFVKVGSYIKLYMIWQPQ